MDRRILIALGVAVAIGVGWFLKNRQDNNTAANDASAQPQSQLPAQEAAMNYTVPPNIGAQVDNTGGLNFPAGMDNMTLTTSQGQSLPIQA